MDSFDNEIKNVIPSVFHVVGSSADDQQSNESYNMKKFGLPNPAGTSGGACTSLLLKHLYEKTPSTTWWNVFNGVQTHLKAMGFENQTPTFTSSRKIDLKKEKIQIVPPGSNKRRALLIGINYTGQPSELRSCQNDCINLKNYLMNKEGFKESEMMILLDDGKHTAPTKENIQNAFLTLVQYSSVGDVNFISFSGHGGQTEDLDGDEEDGMDSTLIPVDAKKEGMIVDDDILRMLVKPMPAGVTTTVVMDCCYSGSVLDLPYELKGTSMAAHKNYNMEIVRTAIKPLSRAELNAKKKREKQARKEARAAERQRRREEDAKRQEELDKDCQQVSNAELEAAKQQLLLQAQADMKNMSLSGKNVVVGPVQVVSGSMPSSGMYGSGPRVLTYKVQVSPGSSATKKLSTTRLMNNSTVTPAPKVTKRSPKPNKLSGLISKFEK